MAVHVAGELTQSFADQYTELVPIPLLAIAAVAFATLVAGTVVAALNWENIMLALQGKRLAVLGERGVGKTSMISFLHTGSLPQKYQMTGGAKRVPQRRFKLKDLDIKLKEGRDLSGDTSAYGDWKNAVDQADFVFYLLRADKLHASNETLEKRAKSDLRHLSDWMERRPKQQPLFIVATHIDKITDYADITPEKHAAYVDRFRQLPIVDELIGLGGGDMRVKLFLGSLKSTDTAEKLVYSMFETLRHD